MMAQEQPQQQQSTTTTPVVTMTNCSSTPPPTPPACVRPILTLSSSLSPPPTPNAYGTPHRQRQMAWLQSSVVRRSSSAVDEAVDELTEKSILLRKQRSSVVATPRASTNTAQRLDSHLEEQGGDDDCDDQQETVNGPLVASFQREEIVVGRLLGEGTFNCVYEVVGFDLNDNDDNPSLRAELATTRTQGSSFALKHLKPSLLQDTLQFEQAATDLVMEAKYLAALNHANILKLHGEPLHGTAAINGGVDGYFLLTDRLSETLAARIDRWVQGEAQDTNTVAIKLQYALQIANALSYLHQQRILFRDLKPSNIGFHQQDTSRVILFDFGLCRELPPPSQARGYVSHEQEQSAVDLGASSCSEYSMDMDGSWDEQDDDDECEQVYFMSGAGTQIYMAPEVLIQNRYNLKADVYSWSMTVTELLLLEKPLEHYELDDHIQYVCVEGDRPALEGHPEITQDVRDLLAWAWEGDVSKRCNMAQVCEELPDIITQVEEEDEAYILPSESWSTRFCHAAQRFQQYLVSILGRALERMSSFWSFRRASTPVGNVTFDLPTQEEQDDADAFATLSTNDDDEDCVLLSPRPGRFQFRNALLKRKPSSASTTAMTDDEYDDDTSHNNENGRPMSPCYNTFTMPPMEALVERHNSTASTATSVA